MACRAWTPSSLHHHAAGLHQLAFESGEGHADYQVAGRAMEAAARAAGIGGDHAPHCGAAGKWGVERRHLAVPRHGAGELAPGQSGFYADSEVARLVLRSEEHTSELQSLR